MLQSGKTIETRFDSSSWIALGLVGLILLLCLAQFSYRLSLPSDGWTFPYEVSEGYQRFVFESYLGDGFTPLQSGDMLVAIERQTVEEMVENAIKLQPQRPTSWRAGQTVEYTISRQGSEIILDVPLTHRSLGAILLHVIAWNAGRFPLVPFQLIIALFVFLRRPRSQAAQLLLLWTTAFLAAAISMPLSGQNSGTTEMFYRGAYWPAWLFNFLLFPLFLVPFVAHFFLIFPVKKRPTRRHPYLTPFLIYGLPPALLSIGFASRLNQPLLFWRAPAEIGLGAVFPLMVLTAAVSLGHTFFTVRSPIRRAQARWLVFGVLVGQGLGQGLLFFLPELGLIEKSPLLPALSGFLGLAFPLSFAVAILRFRLFDIDIIINRTLVYGLLTGILALIYFGTVAVLQGLFRALTAQTSQIAIVVSTLAIAALFNPLRIRIQAFIDRRFYRSRYDAEKALKRFSATARDEVDMDQLTDTLLAVVEETVQPKQVSLWLKSYEPTKKVNQKSTTA